MAFSDDRGEGAGPAEAETLAAEARRAATRQRTNDPYAALRFRDFRYLMASASLATLGEQMLTVAIGWDIYARKHSALMLGFVGLAQFAPVLALSLVAGHAADRFDRRATAMLSQG
ncbi:MAG: MFS transporter, partial [Ktedonobacterales bacterium]